MCGRACGRSCGEFINELWVSCGNDECPHCSTPKTILVMNKG